MKAGLFEQRFFRAFLAVIRRAEYQVRSAPQHQHQHKYLLTHRIRLRTTLPSTLFDIQTLRVEVIVRMILRAKKP